MAEISGPQKKKDRYRLEGALGYALRIAEKIDNKTITSIEELNQVIDVDFRGISSSLARHCRDDLKIAGCDVGLFDDSLKHQAADNQENKT